HARGLALRGVDESLLETLPQPAAARPLGVGARFLDPTGVDVDPDAANTESLRRRDDDASVAAAEIVENISFPDARRFQHLGYHVFRCRHVGHVQLAFRLRRLAQRLCDAPYGQQNNQGNTADRSHGPSEGHYTIAYVLSAAAGCH